MSKIICHHPCTTLNNLFDVRVHTPLANI